MWWSNILSAYLSLFTNLSLMLHDCIDLHKLIRELCSFSWCLQTWISNQSISPFHNIQCVLCAQYNNAADKSIKDSCTVSLHGIKVANGRETYICVPRNTFYVMGHFKRYRYLKTRDQKYNFLWKLVVKQCWSLSFKLWTFKICNFELWTFKVLPSKRTNLSFMSVG